MEVFDKIKRVLKTGSVCDHCLGRQFAQLLSGLRNNERGNILRSYIAFEKDSGESIDINDINFSGIKFRNTSNVKEKKPCWVCEDFFVDGIEKIVKKIDKKLEGIEFETFLIGTRVSSNLLDNEERLWESVGIEWVEPIKAEINREVGRRLETLWGKSANLKNPDIAILIDLGENKITTTVNSFYVYGEYQKLRRGIPQTKWPSGKYKTSVEEIIAKPFMNATLGSDHKFHGAGREDIDALCFAWRPFVLEIVEPKVRSVDIEKLMKSVNKRKSVQVRNMKIVDSKIVEKVKSITPDKEYEVLCVSDKPLERGDRKKILELKGKTISQRTPERVLHRRSDLYRDRKIVDIKFSKVDDKKFKLKIRAESGTYIKEFVSGDNGRTRPSVSGSIGKNVKVKDLDVTRIFVKERIV